MMPMIPQPPRLGAPGGILHTAIDGRDWDDVTSDEEEDTRRRLPACNGAPAPNATMRERTFLEAATAGIACKPVKVWKLPECPPKPKTGRDRWNNRIETETGFRWFGYDYYCSRFRADKWTERATYWSRQPETAKTEAKKSRALDEARRLNELAVNEVLKSQCVKEQMHPHHHNKCLDFQPKLDLHGLYEEEAKTALLSFLRYWNERMDDARQQGITFLKVITGQGNHSRGKPVIRGMTKTLLDELRFDWKFETNNPGALRVRPPAWLIKLGFPQLADGLRM